MQIALASVTPHLEPADATAVHAVPQNAASFVAGFAHPFQGIDHISVMIAVGLWASIKGNRALWVWPLTFVCLALAGGLLGMSGVAIPLVEPGILASVVVFGLMVTLAVDLPVMVGGLIIGVFAVVHGHAHGSGLPDTISGLDYLAGFALATATLHAVGLAMAVGLHGRPVRLAGLLTVLMGVGLWSGVL